MAKLGRMNRLEVVKQVDFGFYLDGGASGEILLPIRYAPPGLQPDDMLDVFIYLDSEDRPIATTETPLAQIGQCACLRVVATNAFGAFLEWGLMKDLFVPFNEQRERMQEGESYVVYLFLDNTDRIAASSKLSQFLYEEDEEDFELGEKVELLIATRSDLGVKAVINGSHLGLIHQNEIFQPLKAGDRINGFIKSIRGDGRINLTLQHKGQAPTGDISQKILAHLRSNGGRSILTDKSDPRDIAAAFGVSKSAYKKALGKLFKEHRIRLESEGVVLL